MSGGVIKSGESGNTAIVDSDGNLKTFSITQSEYVTSAGNGEAYLISHPIVNLTSDSESFVFYLENNDIVSWVIEDVSATFGASQGGSGKEFTSRSVINPSGGTVLTGPNGGAANLNVGSPRELPSTIKTGFEGATAEGGSSLFPGLIISDQNVTEFISAPIILPPSTSFAYAVTPPTGNTSLNVKVNLLAFRDVEI